jgi:rhamnosyltransferase subunit B
VSDRGRVLLVPFGSAGDVHPLVAMGLELERRGLETLTLVAPAFERTVERAGLPTRALRAEDSWDEMVAGAREWSPDARERARRQGHTLENTWGARIGRLFRESRPLAEAFAPGVVVGNAVSMHGVLLAEALGRPWIGASLSPTNWMSADDLPLRGSAGWPRRLPRPLRSAYNAAVRLAVEHSLDPVMNALRAEAGLPPRRRNFYDVPMRGAAALALYSPAFRAPASDDPPGLVTCGFTWFERSGEYGDHAHALAPRLERFLDAGEPPIVVSPGTVRAHANAEIFDLAIAACQRIGRRAVLVTGDGHGGRFDGVANALRVDYAPYSALLHRGALTVHHGGAGTLAWAIRARRPMVVTPMGLDQFDHGARVERLGIGASIPLASLTAGRLAGAMDRLLGDPAARERVERLGAIVEREDGAAVAADHVERVVRGERGA